MASQGWIKLHRQLQDCAIWLNDKPFDDRSAWVDLLLLANHSDKEILFNRKVVVIKRGQYLTSVRKLSERWMWSKDKTLRYLRMLEELRMIIKESDSNRTLLTIVNYEIYQGLCDTDKDTYEDIYKDSIKDAYKDTDKPQTIIKELKNDKNEKKNIYGEFKNVRLTDEELQKLMEKFPDDYQERIENLSSYISSKKKKYSSHYATILTWARRDKQKPVSNGGQRDLLAELMACK